MLQLNIIIVGAGIAGLSTALGLRLQGHNVTILERHSGCQALGGPVSISPNASRVLIAYGLGNIMNEKNNMKHNIAYVRRYKDGAILGSRSAEASIEAFGFPRWEFARFRLQEMLAEAAKGKGAKLLFNSLVVSINQDPPAVNLHDGVEMTADMIIAADGIRSSARSVIVGDSTLQHLVSFSAYNIDIPRSLLAESPELAPFLRQSNIWIGPSQVVVAKNMSDYGDKFNLCLVKEDEAGKEGEWLALGDLDRVRKEFITFEPRIHKLLDLADQKDCHIWRLSEMPPLPTWVSESGRVVVTGDAAHAMLPYTGMGASCCIEDSACLSECLKRVRSMDDLPKVLRAYETIRKPRVEWLVKRGRSNAEMWHLHDGEDQKRRDAVFASGPLAVPAKGVWDGTHIDTPPEGTGHPLQFAYIQGFDVIAHTIRQLDHILA